MSDSAAHPHAGHQQAADPPADSSMSGHDHPIQVLDGQAAWDERYSESDRIWSGQPNGALVAEVVGLEPARVLDVGSGEGADAVWLAGRGWQVTGLEVSTVALDRAAEHATQAGVEIVWVHSGLVEAGLPAGSFDLVSAQYPALLRTPGALAEHALVDAVAVGGTLLVVHHDGIDTHEAAEHGFDLSHYVTPGNVAAVLDQSWEILVDELRDRQVDGGGGAHHTRDVVLKAHRLR